MVSIANIPGDLRVQVPPIDPDQIEFAFDLSWEKEAVYSLVNDVIGFQVGALPGLEIIKCLYIIAGI